MALRLLLALVLLLSVPAAARARAARPASRRALPARAAQTPAPAPAREPSFVNEVLPVLAKAGCNQGACHAKQGGKGGFQLSVLAFDPEADFEAVLRQANGRRVNRTEPGQSLLLLKPTGALPHGGGTRFTVDSPQYRLIARWIATGAPYRRPSEPLLSRVEVQPAEKILKPGQALQLRAIGVYSDGSRRDVTGRAEFHSNEDAVAAASAGGRVTPAGAAGEAAVMVRYMGQVAVARVTVPLPGQPRRNASAPAPRHNWIDEHVYRELAQLNLEPSPPCDDATYLRRVYLDLIGTLPTAAETRAFLEECAREHAAEKPQRSPGSGPKRAGATPAPAVAREARARLVDRLLDRPEYADYAATRWVNLLLVDRDPLFPKGAFAYDRWVRDAFRANMPFDRFARAIVTASGETYRDGPVNFFRSLASPEERGKAVSQLFLGVRLECAQCHHHPSERWSQDDYFGMAAYFARLRRKGSSEFEQVIFAAPDGEVKHPKTGADVPPRALGAPVPAIPEGEDRREHLARWMTAPENPFFARTIVNRTWAHLMGRGLVEPVDDFRVTNPATNEPLLDALARELVSNGYDLKRLLRLITASAAYGRSSQASARNARDTRNYSRALVKRLPAEVLLDAISQVTGVPETYQGHPYGTRAIQMWDNKLPVEFLSVFGRPSRLSVCECDRPSEGSVTQVLHLMNSAAIQNRLTSSEGLVAALAASEKSPDEVVTELYLTAYNRFPLPDELQRARAAFSRPGADRRAAVEDLLWALLNTPEFVFNH